MGYAQEHGPLLEAFILVFKYDYDGRFPGFFKLFCKGQLPFDCAVSERHSLYQGIGSPELLIG